jgi:hypothetical protein
VTLPRIEVSDFSVDDFPMVVCAFARTETGPELVWALTLLEACELRVPPLAKMHRAQIAVAVLTPTEFELAMLEVSL